MNNTYTLYTCGARGTRSVGRKAFLEYGALTTCYVLKSGQHAMVIDCGTGLYFAGEILKDCTHIDILLTHLHYDHIIGLLDWCAFPPHATISFYGTFDLWDVSSFSALFHPPFWPVSKELGEFVNVDRDVPLTLTQGVQVMFHDSQHPNDGNIIRVNTPQCDVCFSFDYEHDHDYPMDFAKGCNLLIYDGTYDDAEYPQYRTWGHSTWQEGCKVGQALDVDLTIISHHNPTSNDDILKSRETQAKALYQNVYFARSGDELDLSTLKKTI